MKQEVRLMSLVGLLALAACGGGGGSSSDGGGSANTLTLSGTAAKGAALAGATVSAKCSVGTGTATTAADGTYTMTLASGTLPCVLMVRDASVTPARDYHSVATGTGSTARANVTTLTQLVVASLIDGDPARFYANFNAGSDASKLGTSAVDAAKTAVIAALQSNGITIPSDAGDPVTGTLVAGSGTAGNSADAVLENLATKLAVDGRTLVDFTAVVQNATTTDPKAATCAALRSGTYRILVPDTIGADGSGATDKIVINAVALTVTGSDNTSLTVTPVSGSPCRFNNALAIDVVVAQSGVLGIKTDDGYFGIGFPEQTIALSDLAGDWNILGYDHDNETDPLTASSATATFNATGGVTVTTACAEAKTCATLNQPRTLSVNASGGFTLTDAGGSGRLFAYRAPNGAMMIAGVGGGGEVYVGARTATADLPEVGRVRQGWNVGTLQRLVGGIYAPVAFETGEFYNTVLSVDAATSSFVRRNVLNVTGPVTRDETLTVNRVDGVARPGYSHRAPNPMSTNSSGQLSRTPETIFLAMPGLGMNASANPAPAWGTPAQTQFTLSIFKP